MVLPQLVAEFLQLCSVKFRVNLLCLIADSLQESSWSNAIEIFASNAHATYSLVMYNAVLAVAEWSQALQMLEDMSQGTVRQVLRGWHMFTVSYPYGSINPVKACWIQQITRPPGTPVAVISWVRASSCRCGDLWRCHGQLPKVWRMAPCLPKTCLTQLMALVSGRFQFRIHV